MGDTTNSRYRYLGFKSTDNYRRYIQGNRSKDIAQAQPDFYVNDVPAHGTYASELFKPEWKQKREEMLKRDNHACVVCKGSNGLQVHHRQYHFVVTERKFKLPWDYPNHLLITLCESCHRRGHGKYKVPMINI